MRSKACLETVVCPSCNSDGWHQYKQKISNYEKLTENLYTSCNQILCTFLVEVKVIFICSSVCKGSHSLNLMEQAWGLTCTFFSLDRMNKVSDFYLSFEVVLPFLRLQCFKASAAVRGDGHTEGPVDSGWELWREGHWDGPHIGLVIPIHH